MCAKYKLGLDCMGRFKGFKSLKRIPLSSLCKQQKHEFENMVMSHTCIMCSVSVCTGA